MHPLITSHQNPKIKNLLSLEKARERKKQNLFLIEGYKELTLAIAGGYEIVSLFFCPEIIQAQALMNVIENENKLVPVEHAVFSKLAYRETTGGIIALARPKDHMLHQLQLSSNPFLIVAEAVEKPGNLGAILRTADAAGADAVIVCDPQTDFYNPNVIRSSVGCVFTNQLASATSADTLLWLKKQGIKIYSAYLQASQPYHETDYTGPCAIALGTESTGLTDEWVKNSSTNIIIPMQGKIDSMNVSTAAAVIAFEVRRQRGFR